MRISAIVDLATGSMRGVDAAARRLEAALNRGVTVGLSRTKNLQSELAKSGIAKEYRKELAGMLKIERSILDSKRRARRAEGELIRGRGRLGADEVSRLQKEVKAQKEMAEKEEKRYKTREARMTSHARNIEDIRKKGQEDREKSALEAANDRAESFSEKLGGLTGGDIDLGSLLSGGMGALSKGLGAASAASSGGAAAALAGLASSVAALAGPIAAVAGVFAMAYSNAKDMNKELMDSASGFDLVGNNIGSLGYTLGELRKANLDLALDLRMSSEEASGIGKAMLDAGITLKEFQGITPNATGDIEAYAEVTKKAALASHGLGLEVSQVADFYSAMTRDLGGNINDIDTAFGMIAAGAQKAGMRTKDFFGAVLESTTGMALYNIRVKDTIGLFEEMVEILGEDLAKASLGLEGTFRGMGMQQRYKEAMLGGKTMKKAVLADAQSQAATFSGTLGDQGKKALSKLGVMNKDGGIDLKALANANGKSFREALSSGELTDVQERQLTTLRELSQATKGTGGVARAMGALSKRGELAAQFAQGAAMFGGKMLSELGTVERMAYEEVVNVSGEEFDKRMRLQDKMMGEYEKRGGKEKLGMSFEQAVAKGMLGDQKELEQLSTQQLNLAEEMGRDSLVETRGIGTTVKNTVARLLEQIATTLDLIYGFFVSDRGKDAAKKQMESARTLMRQNEVAVEKMSANDKRISELQGSLKGERDKGKREKIEEEIKALLEKQSELKDTSVALKSALGKVGQADIKTSEGAKLVGNPDALIKEGRKEIYAKRKEELIAAKAKNIEERREIMGVAGSSSNVNAEGVAKYELEGQEVEELSAAQLEEMKKQSESDLENFRKQHKADKEQKDATEDIRKAIEGGREQDIFMELAASIRSVNEGISQKSILNAIKGQGLTEPMLAALKAGEGEYTVRERTLAEYVEQRIKERNPKAEAEAEAQPEVEGKVDDFIYRGDGRGRGKITKINSKDEFIGAKPGGPVVESLMGGGGRSVVVNINGGDEARVYNVIKKVLSETGYGNMKSY